MWVLHIAGIEDVQHLVIFDELSTSVSRVLYPWRAHVLQWLILHLNRHGLRNYPRRIGGKDTIWGENVEFSLRIYQKPNRRQTFRVSDSTKDSIRSSLELLLKSLIPVRPHSTFPRSSISLRSLSVTTGESEVRKNIRRHTSNIKIMRVLCRPIKVPCRLNKFCKRGEHTSEQSTEERITRS